MTNVHSTTTAEIQDSTIDYARRRVICLVVVILCMHTLLLVHSAKVHSPTWDEVGHLAAGISHWELGRFELYSVNPPLVRTIAAAPVALWSKPKVDWTFYRSSPQLRSEVFVGRRFIEIHGEESFKYFFIARLALIPVSLIGAMFCFLWGRRLFGTVAGVLALAIWCFCPNVLAYGSVITPDLSTAVVMLGCSYVFHRWLCDPGWSLALIMAVAISLAMLTKSIWLILPFVFLSIWTLKVFLVDRKQSSEDGANQQPNVLLSAGQLAVAFAVALVLTNGFYGFAGSLKPLGDFRFISGMLSGVVQEPCENCDASDVATLLKTEGNRFANSWLAAMPIPLPANYLQGIDIQARDIERGYYDKGWKSYLNGEWKQGGWTYFYLLALILKVPLPTWILFGTGAYLAVSWRPDRLTFLGVICLWAPAIALLLLVSLNAGLTRYMRYALPVLPVMFIWASQAGKLIERWSLSHSARRIAAIPVAMCLWLLATTLVTAPHYLSYFNQIAGGPKRGHEFLCDSNVDWGQDLIALKHWLKQNPEAAPNLHLAYFGSYDPATVDIEYRLPQPLPPQNEDGSPGPGDWLGPTPGWHVVSKNFVVGHPMPVPSGTNSVHFKYFGEGAFRYFSEVSPVDSIGESMLVYHLTLEQANELRKNYKLAKLRYKAPNNAVSLTKSPSIQSANGKQPEVE